MNANNSDQGFPFKCSFIKHMFNNNVNLNIIYMLSGNEHLCIYTIDVHTNLNELYYTM